MTEWSYWEMAPTVDHCPLCNEAVDSEWFGRPVTPCSESLRIIYGPCGCQETLVRAQGYSVHPDRREQIRAHVSEGIVERWDHEETAPRWWTDRMAQMLQGGGEIEITLDPAYEGRWTARVYDHPDDLTDEQLRARAQPNTDWPEALETPGRGALVADLLSEIDKELER